MKKYFFIVLTIVGLLFVSCDKEKLIANTEVDAHEIGITAATVSTKSAIDGITFPEGYGMLVSAYRNKEINTSATFDNQDYSSDYFENIRFTCKEGVAGEGTASVLTDKTWRADSPKYWPLNGTLDFLCIASAGIHAPAKGVVPTNVWGEGSSESNKKVATKVVATFSGGNNTKFDDILYGASNGAWYTDDKGEDITFNHALCALAFVFKSNVPYNHDKNLGITVHEVCLYRPHTKGTLTVTNPKSTTSTTSIEGLHAEWSNTNYESPDTLHARIWNNTGAGVDDQESRLSSASIDLSTDYNVTFSTATNDIIEAGKRFGDAYALVIPQNPVSFTIRYTIHNGKDSNNRDINYYGSYKYSPGTADKWEMGKKVIYKITIKLHEVTVEPKVTDWLANPIQPTIG